MCFGYQLPELRGLGWRRAAFDASPAGDCADELRLGGLDGVLDGVAAGDVAVAVLPLHGAAAVAALAAALAVAADDLGDVRESRRGVRAVTSAGHAALPAAKQRKRYVSQRYDRNRVRVCFRGSE